MNKNRYFDIDAFIKDSSKPMTIELIQKPCDVEIEIHAKLNTEKLINILVSLADIIPECELEIHINT